MSHYFSPEPPAAGREHTVRFQVGTWAFALSSSDGVFSAERLDAGTAVLLRKAPLPAVSEPGPLLDLGCGYGPIATVLATAAPAAEVWAVDVNARARELTTKNAAALGFADRVRVAGPDEVPAQLRFSQIWSNPPVRVGKSALRTLLERWLPALAPGGLAWLVVSRHLGADSLHRWLLEGGWRVSRHASQQGYRVLRVDRPSPAGPESTDGD